MATTKTTLNQHPEREHDKGGEHLRTPEYILRP
jgi:hypothetical protein